MNIRATALEEFWGTDFAQSVYLWAGAKHKQTLKEIDEAEAATLSDLFATPGEIDQAFEYCKGKYFDLLPRLASKLNTLHGIDVSVGFWQVAFGYWLFRHICITYEKFSYLSQVDIDHTSIMLLDEKSFYIPEDHYDYVYCFCNDFGVQQLISQYYFLYAGKEFPCVPLDFSLASEQRDPVETRIGIVPQMTKVIRGAKRVAKATLRLLRSSNQVVQTITEKPMLAIFDPCFTADMLATLTLKSEGRIGCIELPGVDAVVAEIDSKTRTALTDIEVKDQFEEFLAKTFFYCFPKIFIERFADHYETYSSDIASKKFTHILSEYWISDMQKSLYIAIAKEAGTKFIANEHGFGTILFKHSMWWIDQAVADICLTSGWRVEAGNVAQGGFTYKNINPYKPEPWKTDILYIGRTKFPYLLEFNEYNWANSKFIQELKLIDDFIGLLPSRLQPHFVFRPRRERLFWDTEHALEIQAKHIRVADGLLQTHILNSRIVIIDHLSTSIAEVLLTKVPCLIINSDELRALSKEHDDLFDDLVKCGVVHNSAFSAVTHLSAVYDDVGQWWNRESVQGAINAFISRALAPPSMTVDYLLSCLQEESPDNGGPVTGVKREARA